jgi:hypothetical protein
MTNDPLPLLAFVEREGYQRGRSPGLPRAGTAVVVKVLSNASGAGIYNGQLWRPPTADVSTSSNLTGAMLGVAGPACIVCNAKEIGASTHTIAANTFLVGHLVRINADGKLVVVVESC